MIADPQPNKSVAFYRAVLDAMPNPVFVVDPDVRLCDFNSAAAGLLDREREQVLQLRGGEALHCVHATDVAEGCGRGPACRDCVVRNSVASAFARQGVVRRRARMEVCRDGKTVPLYVLVTTASFDFEGRAHVLLTLEDISEIVQLRGLLPICASCKKIRDGEEYWHNLESYFSDHLDVDFSHGICPQCIRRLYPEYADEIDPPAATKG